MVRCAMICLLLFCSTFLTSSLKAQSVDVQVVDGISTDCDDDLLCTLFQIKSDNGADFVGNFSIRFNYNPSAVLFEGKLNNVSNSITVGSYTPLNFTETTTECDLIFGGNVVATDFPYGGEGLDGLNAGDVLVTFILDGFVNDESRCPNLGEGWTDVMEVCFDVMNPTEDPNIAIAGIENGNSEGNAGATNFNDDTNDVKFLNGSFTNYNRSFEDNCDACVVLDCDDGCEYTADSFDLVACACVNTLTEPTCDDGCPNTTDSYDVANCACVNTLTTPNCDDACDFTTDSYDAVACECVNASTNPSCDDGCAFTTDSYDAANCECENVSTNPSCDDNCEFTTDSYDATNCECVNVSNPPNCDDGCEYTADSYDANACDCVNTLTTPSCDDADECTNDTYNSTTCACVNTEMPGCGDVLGCTDQCAPNYNPAANVEDDTCEAYNTVCDDDCQYTTDSYDPNNCVCVNTLNTPSCDDSDDCTTDSYDAANCACVNTEIQGCGDVPGCVDPCAPNFNATATVDDGSCQTYDTVCDDGCQYTTDSYDPNNCACVNTLNTPSCDDADDCTTDSYDAANCACMNTEIQACGEVPGCLDPCAPNYDATATVDDGACQAYDTVCDDGCDDTTDSYNSSTCSCVNTLITPSCDDGDICTTDSYDAFNCACVNTEIPGCEGCTDPCAVNYSDLANVDNGSCTPYDTVCDDGCVNTTDMYDEGNCECVNILNTPSCDDSDECTADSYDAANCACVNTEIQDCGDVPGCTDPCAINYNALANVDNGSCTPYDTVCDDGCINTTDMYDEGNCECVNISNTPNCSDGDDCTADSYDAANCACVNTEILGCGVIPGCLDACATNYNANATEDDGSCVGYDTVCDDGCANTTDMYDDGNCECVNILIVPNCDDGDVCTDDSYDEAYCECVSLAVPGCGVAPGCTDPCASNFDSDATEDDGSCAAYDTLCDDGCANTTDMYNDTNCECVNILNTPSCNDGNDCTSDSYDADNCACENVEIVGCGEILGCTDPCSSNYNAMATVDDGNCSTYDTQCDDSCAYTIDSYNSNTCQCVNELSTPDCSDGDDCTTDNYDANNCECVNVAITNCGEMMGCTDPCAPNFDATAMLNDGSCAGYDTACDDNCTYTADMYDEATCSCLNILATPDCNDGNDCTADSFNAANCECVSVEIPGCGEVAGCTDPCAANYDATANVDDGTCTIYDTTCDDGCSNTIDMYDDATCACVHIQTTPDCNDSDECTTDSYDAANCECVNVAIPNCGEIFGCIDPCAGNFNAMATLDDGSCAAYDMVCNDNCPYTSDMYDDATCSCMNVLTAPDCDDNDDCTMDSFNEATCGCEHATIDDCLVVFGCTDPCATNFNSLANEDNGTCLAYDTVCDDGCDYTIDMYDEGTCSCVNVLQTPDCDNGDPCTEDSYDADNCACVSVAVVNCGQILGCTDPCAPNYDPFANEDDNSCATYETICDDQNDCTMDSWDASTCSCQNVMIMGCGDVQGCTDPCASNYNPDASIEDNSCQAYDTVCDDGCNYTTDMYDEATCSCMNVLTAPDCEDGNICTMGVFNAETCACEQTMIEGCGTVMGCTDPCASNYNPDATLDDGMCASYDTVCDDGCSYTADMYDEATCSCMNILSTPTCDDGDDCTADMYDMENCACVSVAIPDCGAVSGCTDACASNYNTDATIDDGTCAAYDTVCDDGNDCTTDSYDQANCACVNVAIANCGDVEGCTDACASNYNADATVDDGSCNDYYTSCDDGCEYTNDTYDYDNCDCINTLILPSCDDNDDCTTDSYDAAACDCIHQDIDDCPSGPQAGETIQVCSGEYVGTLLCVDLEEGEYLNFDYTSSLFGCSLNPSTDNCVNYIPVPAFVGQETITLYICTEEGQATEDCEAVVFHIEVDCFDPTAVPDGAIVSEDGVSFNGEAMAANLEDGLMLDILNNDTNPCDAKLAIEIVTEPANGTAYLNESGQVVYFSDNDYTQDDLIVYEICTACGACDQAVVTIEVENPCEPTTHNLCTEWVTPIVICPDFCIDDYEITGVEGGFDCGVRLDGECFKYTPSPLFTGEELMEVTACNNDGDCATAYIELIVGGCSNNDAPIAFFDQATSDEDGTTICVLENDVDPNGNALSVSDFTQPANGSVTQMGNCLIYEPDNGFTGTDVFSYETCDSFGNCNTAYVQVN